MKPTTPTPPEITNGGNPEPTWVAIIFALATMVTIILWSYIISKQ